MICGLYQYAEVSLSNFTLGFLGISTKSSKQYKVMSHKPVTIQFEDSDYSINSPSSTKNVHVSEYLAEQNIRMLHDWKDFI